MTVTVTTPTLTALMLITFPASERVSGAVIQETSLVTVEQWRRTVTAPTLHYTTLTLHYTTLTQLSCVATRGANSDEWAWEPSPLTHSLTRSQETQLAHIRILFQSKFKLNRRIGAHLMLCNGTLYPRPIAL
jgi:hypothetical protein